MTGFSTTTVLPGTLTSFTTSLMTSMGFSTSMVLTTSFSTSTIFSTGTSLITSWVTIFSTGTSLMVSVEQAIEARTTNSPISSAALLNLFTIPLPDTVLLTWPWDAPMPAQRFGQEASGVSRRRTGDSLGAVSVACQHCASVHKRSGPHTEPMSTARLPLIEYSMSVGRATSETMGKSVCGWARSRYS